MIGRVSHTAVLAEHELIAEYAAECSNPAIGPHDPQAYIYAALEQNGVLHCFGAFKGERMVGFAFLLTPILPHYGKRVGTIESLFVGSQHRRGGTGHQLRSTVAEFARHEGCVGILSSAPFGSQFEKVLEASKDEKRTNSVFFRSLV